MTSQEQEKKYYQLKRDNTGKLIGRTLAHLLAKDKKKEVKALINFAGQQGGKLFYDKYGPAIEREMTNIAHKVIDKSKLILHANHESHIEASAKTLADQIWAEHDPNRQQKRG